MLSSFSRALGVFCLASGLLLGPALAAGSPDAKAAGDDWHYLTLVGQAGGVVSAVEVAGDRAYLAVGPRVVVLDVSRPETPVKLGESPVLSTIVQDLALNGHHVYAGLGRPEWVSYFGDDYAGTQDSGLAGDENNLADAGAVVTLDVADPRAVKVVARQPMPGGVRRLLRQDQRLLVGLGPVGRLEILDISAPDMPRPVGSYQDLDTQPYDLAASGTTLLVGTGDTWLDESCSQGGGGSKGGDLVLLDARDPTDLRPQARLDWEYRVATEGGFAYAAGHAPNSNHDRELRVIELVPGHPPRPRGRLNTSYSTTRLVAAGGRLYLTDEGGLTVIDVTNPDHPRQLGDVAVGREPWDVAVAGNYALVAARRDGLAVVEISNPAAPRVVGRYRRLGVATRAALTARRLVLHDFCEVDVVEVADGAEPHVAAHLAPTWPRFDGRGLGQLEANDAAAFVTVDYGRGLLRVGAEDPTGPALRELFAEGPGVGGLAVDDAHAYLGEASPEPAVAVADIAAAGAERIRARAPTQAPWRLMALGDGLLFGLAAAPVTVCCSGDVVALDVADPGQPRALVMAEPPLPVYTQDQLALDGNHLLVGGSELNIVDVSRPTAPRLAWWDRDPAHGPLVMGGTLYAGANESVQALRVDALSGTVRHRGGTAVADMPRDLAGRDNRLYVAAGAAGLIVLDVTVGPPGARLFLPRVDRPAATPQR